MRCNKTANFGEPSIKPQLPGFFSGYKQHDNDYPTLKQMKTVFDNASFSLPKSGIDKLIAYHSMTQDKLEEMFNCFPAYLDVHQKYKYLREELKKAKDVFYVEPNVADSNFRSLCQWLITAASRQHIVQPEISEWAEELDGLFEYLDKFPTFIRTLKNSLVKPDRTNKSFSIKIQQSFEDFCIKTKNGRQQFEAKWLKKLRAEGTDVNWYIGCYVCDEIRREIREIQQYSLLDYNQCIEKLGEIQCLINFLMDFLSKVGANHESLESLAPLKNCVDRLIPFDELSKTIAFFINFVVIPKSEVSQLFFTNYSEKLRAFISLYEKLDSVRDEFTQQELKFLGKRKADHLAKVCGDKDPQKIPRQRSPSSIVDTPVSGF